MANCMTCRHNDKETRYCHLKELHTDLGYVLNCVAWAPTDEAEMRRLRTENAKLRADLKDMAEILVMFARGQDETSDRLNLETDRLMPIVVAYLRELGIEVTHG